MVVAQTYDGKPVTAGDVNAQGALTALLKDAINPNLVQTLGGTPAFVHGGPFANIAHGCNSLIATRTALAHADVVLTEGGFGSDLGAEKFFDIKARAGDLDVSAVVIVATIRSLKYNGGLARDQLTTENLDALQQGVANLARHVENVRKFGAEPVVALNSFTSDTDVEKQWLADWAQANNVTLVPCDVWAHGGAGATNLADAVLTTIDAATPTHPLYRRWPGSQHHHHRPGTLPRHQRGIHQTSPHRPGLPRCKRVGHPPRVHLQNPILIQRRPHPPRRRRRPRPPRPATPAPHRGRLHRGTHRKRYDHARAPQETRS